MLKTTLCRLAAAHFAAGVLLLAQPSLLPAPAARPIAPNEVVATVEGEKLTPARIQQLRDSLPQQFQQAASRMDNRSFLKSYGELLALSRLAEKDKVSEKDPYKGQFDFIRMNFLAQSYLDYLGKTADVSQQDYTNYYNEHKADFEEADVRAIYVAFLPADAKPPTADLPKKPLTEQEAKAKADSLVAQLKKDGDFSTLAKENSDDAATAQKGGDLGTLKKSAQGIPQDLRDIIFGLKAGEISEPVRQQSGFYIFKVDKARTIPFDEAAITLAPIVRSLKVKAELDRILKDVKITYDNPIFFDTPAPGAPAAPPTNIQLVPPKPATPSSPAPKPAAPAVAPSPNK